MDQDVEPASQLIGGSVGNELSSQRTAMAFERTALATDRTLMSVVRTSLSLIGFGFTIFQFFKKIGGQFLPPNVLPEEAPRRFGLALIVLGVIMLSYGIYNHEHAARERRRRRQALFDEGLIRNPEIKRPNSARIIAVLLLLVGLLAISSVALRTGPF